ncbi:MAG: BolA family transcriptional regulator [Lentisphaeraceae bacterium]|nr:BolA family transcriptional regulator [Lentisphaeraceae bacterium]
MTNTEKEIRDILTKEFQPQLLDVIDESHLHAGHMGAVEGVSTHFRVKIVSEKFEGTPKIKQHKLVYKALEDQLNGDVHSLALNTIKKSKWEV